VGFHVSQTRRGGGTVPDHLVQPAARDHVRMRGTDGDPPRCVALDGVVGQHTGCAIYEGRPQPCRDFEPSRPGAPNPHCDAARARHGLAPLR
jgi:Fe-S-cluster containining protein